MASLIRVRLLSVSPSHLLNNWLEWSIWNKGITEENFRGGDTEIVHYQDEKPSGPGNQSEGNG